LYTVSTDRAKIDGNVRTNIELTQDNREIRRYSLQALNIAEAEEEMLVSTIGVFLFVMVVSCLQQLYLALKIRKTSEAKGSRQVAP
jgi:hypothetical protein